LNLPKSATAAVPANAAAAGETSSDVILVNRIAAGDKLAMQALFARHRTSSEVFLDVWRQADRFERRSSVSTWLMSIARHKALSARRGRAEDELTEEMEANVVDTADDPEGALQEKDRGELLRSALTR
jgi:RNA polymerase sigma-70 factor (ECF subfamily)